MEIGMEGARRGTRFWACPGRTSALTSAALGELVGGGAPSLYLLGALHLSLQCLSPFSTRGLISPEVGGEFVKQTAIRPHPRGEVTGSSSGRVWGVGGGCSAGVKGREASELVCYHRFPVWIRGFPKPTFLASGVPGQGVGPSLPGWMEILGRMFFYPFWVESFLECKGAEKGLISRPRGLRNPRLGMCVSVCRQPARSSLSPPCTSPRPQLPDSEMGASGG